MDTCKMHIILCLSHVISERVNMFFVFCDCIRTLIIAKVASARARERRRRRRRQEANSERWLERMANRRRPTRACARARANKSASGLIVRAHLRQTLFLLSVACARLRRLVR